MSHFISFVRIPALALRQHIRPLPRIHVLAEDTLAMRVWPNGIDFNLHMNNARYLSAMDYSRWWAQCGLPTAAPCRSSPASPSPRA